MAQTAGPVTRFLVRLADFSGGLNTSTNQLLIDLKQTPNCKNVISRSKTRYLTRRPGFTRIPVVGPT